MNWIFYLFPHFTCFIYRVKIIWISMLRKMLT